MYQQPLPLETSPTPSDQPGKRIPPGYSDGESEAENDEGEEGDDGGKSKIEVRREKNRVKQRNLRRE
jgi:hypothetical protein